ncbi:L-type lectin-domain containing receptor kinase IX.1-like [Corylus avellana]|uniref:L-type lectin-domain containing receptor kinase IX.1-like n=1 Tax=Corylus avellana TaxID=13451 RepID=UPI00286D474A|nr:L-type lectin-domain containing receptor kinase IX.1-like [Corylus avellana]
MACLHCLNISCIVVCIFSHFFIPFAHPLSFNITHFDHPGGSKIVYNGDATAADGAIVLNKDDENGVGTVGWATYADGVHLWENCLTGITHKADFTAHFSFTINNVNASDGAGAGLAFFMAPLHYTIPPNSAGKELGLFNTTTKLAMSKNHIVAVVFDTFPNSTAPQVGIKENSVRSVVSADWDAYSHAGKMANVWITYNATTNNLSVFWTYEKNPVFKGNSSLSCLIDLKEVLSSKRVTIGFSGTTSSKLERHVIHSWDFQSNSDSLEVSCSRIRRFRTCFVTFVVGCSLSLIILVGIISWFVLRRRRNRNHRHGNDADSDSSISTNLERGALPRKFSYLELVAGTNGFANDRRLGQGGSGQVYKGSLRGLGRPVAVKRIFTESKHSESLFINEVKIISRLIHRNLVQFIGWCHEQGEFLLVYEYMPNGSLDNHLFGHGETLPWSARYKIALGLASALHYLHEEAEKYCVLHRDIKSANVLLDTDFSTKLGDFGVAELVDPRSRTHTTGVVGTYGYLAPEYANEGRASKESDMFSFGVVALEIACGRRTFHDGEYHVSLVTWVWEFYLAGDLLQAADERLSMSFSEDQMRCLLIVGLWCTNPNYRERPKAGQVIKVLQLEVALPELPPDMHDPLLHPLLKTKGELGSFRPSITSSLKDLGR